MSFKTSNEIITGSPDIQVTVSEFSKKHKIEVSQKDLKKYGDAILNLSEIKKLKQGETTISEIIKLRLFNLKGDVDTKLIKQEAERKDNIRKKAENEAEIDLKKAENQVEKNLNSQTSQKLEQGFKKIKEVSGDAGDIVAEIGLWKTLENIPFIGGFLKFIQKFFGWLKGIFGFGDKAGEVVGKLAKKLSPEKAQETKNEIKNLAIKSVEDLDKKLTKSGVPIMTKEEKKELVKLLEDPEFFTEEELALIKEKLESGEIKSIFELKGILSEKKIGRLNEVIFTKQRSETIKTIITKKISDEITKKYGIETDLSSRKRQELTKLIEEYCIPNDFIDLGKNFLEGEWINVGDIGFLALGTGVDMGVFILKLFSNGIVFADDIVIAGYKSAKKILSLSLRGIGLEVPLTEKVLEELGSLSDKQKNILFGVMAREGGFIFELVSSATFHLSRTLVEGAINIPTNNSKLLAQGFMGDFESQIKQFEKIRKALNIPEGLGNDLKNISKLFIELEENSKILKAIQNNQNNISGIKNELEKLEKLGNNKASSVLKDIDWSKTTFSEIKETIKNSINNSQTFGSGQGRFSISSLWKRLKERFSILKGSGNYHKTLNGMYRLEHRVNNIFNYQKAFLEGGIGKGWSRIKTIPDFFRISPDTNKLIIETTAKNLPTRINTLKQIATESPEFLSSIVGSGMVISIIASQDEIISKKTLKDLSYITPLVGPLMVIKEMGWKLGENGNIEAKNIALGMSSLIFLGIDGSYFITNGIRGGLSHIIRPFVATGSSIFNIGKMGRLWVDYFKGNEVIKGEIQTSIKRSIRSMGKEIVRGKRGKLGLVGLALIGLYMGLDYLDKQDIKNLEEKGFIKDKVFDIDKIKKGANDKEKSIILNDIILSGIKGIPGIEVKVDDNSIKILSKERKYIPIEVFLGDYFYILESVYGINSNEITFEYIGK